MPRASAHHDVPQNRLADHLPALRAKLEQQRQFRVEQLTELKAMVGDTATPADATSLARREVTIKVAAAARQALAAIDVALALMTHGGYGRCRRCHADIPLRLLQVIPASRLCLDCRRRHTPTDGPAAGSGPVRGQPGTASRTPGRHRRRTRPRRRHGPRGSRHELYRDTI